MPKREIRTFCSEVRASPREGGGLRFEGYAARFNSPSEDLGGFIEDIAQGAFTEAIARDDVRALFNHDPNYVLGRTAAGTLTLEEDENGLRFDVDAPDIGWAKDLHESVKRGDIDQCSFAFDVEQDEWTRGKDGNPDRRTLKKVRLYDVSIVTYPAYQATSVHARSYAGEDNGAGVENLRRKLDLKEKEWGNHE